MRYRRMVDGEPQFGQSQKDFLQGIDAVAQAIQTRLRLFTGEWWEDQKDGLPVWTQIIGFGGNNKDKIGTVITKRILETKLNDTRLVSGMSNVVNDFNGITRKYTYTGSAKSIYGLITITNG